MGDKDIPGDPDGPPRVVVMMSPVAKIAEVVGRALVKCLNEGVMSEAQIRSFYKAMRLSMAELDNELLDLESEVQHALETELAASASPLTSEAGDPTSGEGPKLVPINRGTTEQKPTHIPTTRKVN